MTPFVFNILVHYYVSPEPYNGGGSPGAIEMAVEGLVQLGMLQESDEDTRKSYGAMYRATEKAVFWINAVLNTPLPVSKWTIPEPHK